MNKNDESCLISIIVPVYNCGLYIQRCLDSLLAQTYKQIEILVIDDGSTDNSFDISSGYSKKCDLISVYHKENGGLSSARNFGLLKAKGKYIGFVDGDDYVAPTMYQDLIESLLENDDFCIASSNIVRFYDNNQTKIYFSHKKEKVPQADFLSSLLLHKGDVSVCNKLFPSHIFKSRNFEEGKLNEDFLFFYGLKFDSIIYTGKEGYYYYSRAGSISQSFSQALIDMASNATSVFNNMSTSDEHYHEALRFAVVQNINFMLKCPRKKRNKDFAPYLEALSFLKEVKSDAKNNMYLTKKDKTYLKALVSFPKMFLFAYHLFR